MTIIGNRLTHSQKSGVAFIPAAVNSTTTAGATILEPWMYGRTIMFHILASVPASTNITAPIQGQLRSSGAWEDITGLALTGAALNDGGTADQGLLQAELDLGALDSTTYKAIRLELTNAAATSGIYAASYSIGDLYTAPSGDVDDLWDDQRAL